jgi:hypothetical protein
VAPRCRVARHKSPPEERQAQAQATMNLGKIWPRTAIWNATVVHHGSLDFIRDDGDDDDDDGDDDDDEMTAGKLIRQDASSHTESCMIMIIWGRGGVGLHVMSVHIMSVPAFHLL